VEPLTQASLLIARKGSDGLPVVYAGRDETARLATGEFAGFVSRMTGCRVTVLGKRPSDGPCVELMEVPALEGRLGPDGFRRTVSAAGMVLEAATGRGLVFGVCDLLEDLGCRWYYPGPVGQRIPRLETARVSHGVKESAPALPGRTLIIGHDLYLGDVEGWVRWAAFSRLTGIFLHEFPPVSLGGRSSRHWRDALARTVPAARLHGLRVEFGGHGLSALLPRALFRRHPHFFRHDGNRRTPDHNFCPSSSGALDVIRREARSYFESRPGADVYHLWPDDVVGGGWCRCESCAGLSPSDQALIATNAVAEVLGEIDGRALLAFLAYHDTIGPPERVRPRSNVAFLYAPRERCYAHGLGDTACAVNRDYHARLTRGVAGFSGLLHESRPAAPAHAAPPAASGRARAGRVRVFEYYLDAVLFRSMAPPLPRVMAGDLETYLASGVDDVGVLMTSDRPWLAPPPNLWLFSRLAWNPEGDLGKLTADFASGALEVPGTGPADNPAPGASYEKAGGFYDNLERAFGLLLELDGQEVELRMPGGNLLSHPPKDTIDFLQGSPGARVTKLRQLEEALDLLARTGGPLAGSPEIDLARRQFTYLAMRQAVVAAAGLGTRASGQRRALGRAWAALAAIARWGRRNLGLGPAYWQFLFFHAPWELHLLKLERETAGSGPAAGGGAGIRPRDVAALFRLGLRYLCLRLSSVFPRRPSPYHRTSARGPSPWPAARGAPPEGRAAPHETG